MARVLWLGTALLVFAVNASANLPLKAEVMHWWTSPGESAAVQQFAEAFNKAGGEWVNVAVVGGNNAIPAEISRVIGGDPPTAMQLPLGKQLDDLVAQHLLSNLDDLATQENIKAIIPDVFLKAATYDGHVYALPVNNHGHNWLWYNKSVLEKAGAKEPVTWEDFWEAVNQIKPLGGIIPVAVGAQPWQLGQTFFSVLLGENGRTDFTVSADAFVFPVNNKDPEQTKAQKLLAKVMIDPATQIAFNSRKGSEPVRLDLDAAKLDACAQYGMKALQKPDQRIPCTDFLDTPDFIAAERDLTAQFWADKPMSVDQFVDAFVKIVETGKTRR